MIVTVRLPRALVEHSGGLGSLNVEVPEGSTLVEIVAVIAERHPAVGRRIVDESGRQRRHVNIYVGNEECRRLEGLQTVVPPDAEIFVIGSIAGGCTQVP